MSNDFQACDGCPLPRACELHRARCEWTRKTRERAARQAEREAIEAANPVARPVQGVQAQRKSAGGAGAGSSPATRHQSPATHWGPPLWAELHRYAAAYAGDEAGARAWLRQFAGRLETCSCRAGWGEILTRFPPDLSGPSGMMRWSWIAHNEVNRLLGKPEVAWEVACAIWGWSTS